MQLSTLANYRAFGLPQLLSISESDCGDYSPAGVTKIHNLLRSRMKAMKRLQRRGHWAYCPAAHLALIDAFKLERIAYERLHPITLLRAEASNSSEAQKHAA